MRTPSARTRKLLGLSAGPMAVVTAGVLIWSGSNAAFTASTASPGNNWDSGQVTLSNTGGASAAFDVQNAIPGDTGSKCLEVTSGSDVSGAVKAYVSNPTGNSTGIPKIADHLKVTMTRGPVGSSCSDFPATGAVSVFPSASLTDLATTKGSYASAGDAVTMGSKEKVAYMINWAFDVNGLDQPAVNSLQNQAAGLDFVWEIQARRS